MIIGLSGYAQSGKDTVAKYLLEKYNYKRVAFADNIRSFLYDINPRIGGIRLQELVDRDGWDTAKVIPEVRRLLQDVGVSARTHFGESFWVDQAMRKIITTDVVITDVRFKNEAQMIRNNGGQIWRVIRPGITAVNDHISEHDMSDWDFDFDLYNDSSLLNLHDDIDILMEDVRV